MTKNLVGAMPDDHLGIAQEFIRRLREESGFPERAKQWLAGKITDSASVISHPFAQLAKHLSKRFGHPITVDSYPSEFTDEFLANAAQYNLRPVFLPGEEIGQNRTLKRWTKPYAWFYDQVRAGNVKPYAGYPPTTLQRGWYLADFTLGVNYTNSTQVLPNDPWSELITRLRQDKIGKYDQTPLGSRFAITHDEWENTLLPNMAEAINVPPAKVRLERAIEFNAIGNLYDHNRGKFNQWEWFADQFGDSGRLGGGGPWRWWLGRRRLRLVVLWSVSFPSSLGPWSPRSWTNRPRACSRPFHFYPKIL